MWGLIGGFSALGIRKGWLQHICQRYPRFVAKEINDIFGLFWGRNGGSYRIRDLCLVCFVYFFSEWASKKWKVSKSLPTKMDGLAPRGVLVDGLALQQLCGRFLWNVSSFQSLVASKLGVPKPGVNLKRRLPESGWLRKHHFSYLDASYYFHVHTDRLLAYHGWAVDPGEDLWGRRQRHPFASFWWGWTGAAGSWRTSRRGRGVVGWRWLEPGDSLGNNGKLQERSPNGWRLEMWWFRRRFRDGRIDLWMFFMGCLVLWSLFIRTRKDQKKFVEVCHEPKKGATPVLVSWTWTILHYWWLKTSIGICIVCISLFVPWQGCIYRWCFTFSPMCWLD